MATTTKTPTLLSLNTAGYTVNDPAEDVRDRTVIDRDGQEIGSVDDLLIDDQEHKVRFLRIKEGGFLGFGARLFLVPVDAVTRVAEDEVHIDREGQHVAAGPVYDPDVAGEEEWRRLADQEDGYYADVYRHYGLSPFWAPGYVYPGYPLYA